MRCSTWILTVSLLGCGQAEKTPGTEGGPCFANKTCHAPLACLSDLCVQATVDAGGDSTLSADRPNRDSAELPGDGGPAKKDSDPCGGCIDTLACTIDACTGTPPVCTHAVASGYCVINNTCLSSNTVNPQNGCQRCDPMVSSISWTSFPSAGCLITVAGSGKPGHSDGPALTAALSDPRGLWLDAAGRLTFTDRGNHCIRTFFGGQVTTIAGTGVAGSAEGPALSASFNHPTGLVVDSSGAIYVADSGNNKVRKIALGTVSTLAGTGTSGFLDGQAMTAKLTNPTDVALDAAGRVYVADLGNHRVRLIDGGQVTTFAGQGASGCIDGFAHQATFGQVSGIALVGSKLFVADSTCHKIRVIDAGQVTTVAGSGTQGYLDATAAQAQFNEPNDVIVDGLGKIYVSEKSNHVRTVESGQVKTLAGSGVMGFADGPALSAQLSTPWGLALGPSKLLYIADAANQRIRGFYP